MRWEAVRKWLGAAWFDYVAVTLRTLGLAFAAAGVLTETARPAIFVLGAAMILFGSIAAREAEQRQKDDEDA